MRTLEADDINITATYQVFNIGCLAEHHLIEQVPVDWLKHKIT